MLQGNRHHWDIVDKFVLMSITDVDGNITYASQAFCDAMVYTKEELIGKNHRIMKHDTSPDTYLEMWSSITAGSIWTAEIQNKAKDDSLHWYKAQITPIVENDIITGYVAIRENISEKKEAQKLATTDSLTGLYNRRKLDKTLNLHNDMNDLYNIPYCVIIIDVDNFKDTNDQYGHQVGDSVLQELSDILRNGMRSTDIVGRWGGEEFLIILPNTKHRSALGVAENLRKIVSEYNFKHVDNKTISLGVTEYNGDIDDTLKKADDALYRAKKEGRDRVCS